MEDTVPLPERKGAGLRWWFLCFLGALCLAFLTLKAQGLARAWALNRAAVATARGLLAADAPLAAAERLLGSSLLEGDCQALWLQGLAAHRQGEVRARDAAWGQWLACPGARVEFVEAILGDDFRWAERSVRLASRDAEGWFWLARLRAGADPEEAIALYRQGFARNPFDALRWRELGDLLAGQDPEAAIQAYLNSCYYGDPGSNGCYRAGKTAERLGDYVRAAQYYRLSRNEGIRQLASEMEKRLQMQGGKP